MSEFRPRPGEVDDILRRGARVRFTHAAIAGLVTAGLLSAAVVMPNGASRHAIEPADPFPTESASATESASPSATATPDATPTATNEPTGTPSPEPSATTPPALRCAAGANGGATDTGVDADSVALFLTVTKTGTATPYFDGWDRVLMAAVDPVNRDGGICGRRLALSIADDGSAVSQGYNAIRAALDRGTFAMTILGIPEALTAAHRYVEADGAQVVGMPTRDPDFYAKDWVWPAGVSDAALAKYLVRDAYQRGARTFGVVYDDDAVAAAFDAEVVRLTGANAKRQKSSRCPCPGLSADSHEFHAVAPDFVALLTRPSYALPWMQDIYTPAADSDRVSHGYGVTDALLGESFREQCAAKCNTMRAWSAYKASCGAYASDPAYTRYLAALAAAHVEPSDGSVAVYAGAQLLVAAIRAAGPDLTRTRLRSVLGSAPLDVDLTVAGTLTGRNDTVRAYDLTYSGSPRCALGPVARLAP